MTAAMFQGEGGYTSVVGEKVKGKLPHPPIQAMQSGGNMSDLQFMLHNERSQHEDAYRYANGHNDHGMGQ